MAIKKILTDVEIDGDIDIIDLTASNRIYLGDGGNGYFYSDSDGRTTFNGGDLYIQGGVGTYYNYANVQYHGAGSGDSHRFRGNELTGDNWGIDTSGNITGNNLSGTNTGDQDLSGYALTANVPTATSDLTNDSGFLSSVTGDWTGTFDGQEGSYYLNYNNLTNLPTLAPSNAEQNVQSDWNATSGDAFIKNKPSLFDGAYSSLSGLPTLFDGAYSSLSGLPTLFDGAYSSLTGTPTIPTNNNQLTNGANYITGYTVTEGDVTAHEDALSIAYSQLTGTPTIPNISGKLDNTTDTLTGTLTVTQDVIADRLESSTSIQMGNDTDAASSSNVGSLRYRATSNNSYTDMCMQTGPTTYEWVNIVSVQFEQP